MWELVSQLADEAITLDAAAAIGERLDDVRAAYVEFYAEAEAVAQSSIAAARRTGAANAAPHRRPGLPRPVLWLIRRVPVRWRRSRADPRAPRARAGAAERPGTLSSRLPSGAGCSVDSRSSTVRVSGSVASSSSASRTRAIAGSASSPAGRP